MADTIHAILFAYPAFTGFILAVAMLAIVLRGLRWWEGRKQFADIHSSPHDVEKRSRRAF